jgi:uncharacterized protein YuzE
VIHLGPYAFDNVVYDAESDVLYLSIGDPRPAYDAPETPEGHGVRYNESYEVIGVTIVGAKEGLERDGKITVTFPEAPAIANTSEVEAALAA